MHHNFPLFLFVAGPILIAIYLWRWKTGKTSLLKSSLVILALLAIMTAMIIFPPISRFPRAYVDGKDQRQWASLLDSKDVAERKQAIAALCEMLTDKSANPFVRDYALGSLKYARAVEALPTLRELEKDANDPFRKQLREAIDEISRPTDESKNKE